VKPFKRGILLILIVFFVQSGFAQLTVPQFKAQAESYYHNLMDSEIQNFSCLITSSTFIDYVKDKVKDSEIYPLKFIWTREGKLYFILQPFPSEITAQQQQEYVRAAQAVRKLFRSVFYDWDKFELSTPFEDIPDSARVFVGTDTVGVHYKIHSNNFRASVKRSFTRSGELFREIWKSEKIKIINYPIYEVVEGKWLCRGWDTQVYENNEIKSGMAIQLNLTKVEGFWLPSQIDILAQSSQNPDQKVLTSIYIRDYIFNENLQTIQQSVTEKPKENSLTPK